MSAGTGALTLKALPGYVFLRWDVVVASLVAAFVFAVLSRPSAKSPADGQPVR